MNSDETTKGEKPINEGAKCTQCVHRQVCGKFATMVGTNEQFMQDCVFALTMNPIDVNYVAEHCKEYVTEGGKFPTKQIPVEDLV